VEPGEATFGLRMRWLERAVGSNRILLYLAGVTLVLSAAAGVGHALDREEERRAAGDPVRESLARIERRLAAIESKLP
jgi:hypothetical protein